jgi:3-hydroxyacyl-CoA dehydrogenase
MLVNGINKVCILGAGTMGLQISLMSSWAGYEVVVYDISPESLKQAPARHQQIAQWIERSGRFKFGKLSEVLPRINYTDDAFNAARNTDLLSESVPEQLELKHEIHRQFESLCPERAIITTNTSSLLVSEIDVVLKRPEQFAAMHFHSGMTLLVDIMRGSKTSEQTVLTIRKFVRSIGLVPMIMKKEKAGYLHNSILVAQLNAALSLAANGYGEPFDVDRAWMMVTGQASGPFGAMDSIGVNVVYDIVRSVNEAEYPDKSKMITFLQPYIERGEYGVKTGKGFYTYPDPAFSRSDFLDIKDS